MSPMSRSSPQIPHVLQHPGTGNLQRGSQHPGPESIPVRAQADPALHRELRGLEGQNMERFLPGEVPLKGRRLAGNRRMDGTRPDAFPDPG